MNKQARLYLWKGSLPTQDIKYGDQVNYTSSQTFYKYLNPAI